MHKDDMEKGSMIPIDIEIIFPEAIRIPFLGKCPRLPWCVELKSSWQQELCFSLSVRTSTGMTGQKQLDAPPSAYRLTGNAHKVEPDRLASGGQEIGYIRMQTGVRGRSL